MKEIPGCLGLYLLKAPFIENGFIRRIIWESRDRVFKYSGERLQKDSYRERL